ncbi:hypothetical protein L1049_005800 [Liquidambar formosana]|uniref:PLATZ transcription factor family protein n=1 Tax=Liquidambar formosana TaxID=63359 RepID=A0AAP0REW0_LIQFO
MYLIASWGVYIQYLSAFIAKLQLIRRYVYSDVINRQDLRKLFNCSGIQTYHTNKAQVLFLKRKPQQKHPQQQNNSRDHSCIICDRSLQDPNSLYCSIACKVLAIYGNGHKDESSDDHNNQNNNKKEDDLEYSQDGDVEDLILPSPKRRKLNRKRVPQRAPMF